jgi:hypothetical protein
VNGLGRFMQRSKKLIRSGIDKGKNAGCFVLVCSLSVFVRKKERDIFATRELLV